MSSTRRTTDDPVPDPVRGEGRHAPGDVPGWREWWRFDFASPSDDVAGWAELVLFPQTQRAWYHAFVVGRRRQLVAVVDHAVPFPTSTLEIRTHGLWADHICETPGVHWTIGLEAFGVGLDDPAEMYGRQLGDQVPLGFDLEWESDDPAGATLEVVSGAVCGYSLACDVSGELLIGDDVLDVVATGARHHRWGTPLGATGDVVADAGVVAVTPLAVPDPLGPTKRPRVVVEADDDTWIWIDLLEDSPG